MASNRHVALALPLPSNASHNAAGTAELPKLLADVHATLVAAGDILRAHGVAVNRARCSASRLIATAGGTVRRGRGVARGVQGNLAIRYERHRGRADSAHAGERVHRRFVRGFRRGARGRRACGGSGNAGPERARTRRLPNPAPATNATPPALAASSSTLTHALDRAGTVTPEGAGRLVSRPSR